MQDIAGLQCRHVLLLLLLRVLLVPCRRLLLLGRLFWPDQLAALIAPTQRTGFLSNVFGKQSTFIAAG